MRQCRLALLPSEGTVLEVLVAERLADRLRGLLGREWLARRHALWIRPCRLVHTFGMREPIDLVFVDRYGRIVRVDAGVMPRRMRGCLAAHGVLELTAGSARRLGLDAPSARLACRLPDDAPVSGRASRQ
jgi:uncharacterized membrane protein (UPF0127 family)